jgi:hypothetical protein
MEQEDTMYSKANSRRNRVRSVDIVEAVRHGKKRGVLSGCDEIEGRPGI